MGIGLMLCVPADAASAVIEAATALGDKAYLVGKTVAGEGVKLLGADA